MRRDLSWMTLGLCQTVGGDFWHPDIDAEPIKDGQRARALCIQCPVRRDCLRYALENDERTGIWGGHNFHRMKKEVREKLIEELSVQVLDSGFPHGTERGYKRHIRRKEEPCAPCARANAAATRQRSRGQTA